MITYSVIGDKIAGSIGDAPFSIEHNKDLLKKLKGFEEALEKTTDVEKYNGILESAKELVSQDLASVIETECEYIKVDKKTNEFFLQYNGVLSTVPMPKVLVDRILETQDKEMDFMPLVKCWVRFLRNPNVNKPGKGKKFAKKFFNFVNLKYMHPKLKQEFLDKGFSDKVAEERATIYQMRITNEGLLNGYKVSAEHTVKYVADEDGKPVQKPRYLQSFDQNTGEITGDGLPSTVEERIFVPGVMGMTGDPFSCVGPNGFEKLGHFIKVGCTHALDSWDQVNCNDDQSCVKGLHFGGLMYINSYRGHIHNVFVDPMHIGAVPDDSTGAIRCKQYFVHSSLSGINGSIYHSSKYAEATDKEWDEMLKEAVAAKLEKVKKAEAKAEELGALS